MIKKYRKKPVVIEAVQWNGENFEEIIQFTGQLHEDSFFKDNLFFSMIGYPGFLIQKITTREPTRKQIEVAIHSLKKVI